MAKRDVTSSKNTRAGCGERRRFRADQCIQDSLVPAMLPLGQTNITERDPTRYDIDWWRRLLEETQVQGVVINAGGIVAYYPSKYLCTTGRSSCVNRDLYGELAEAAHKDGLVVFARNGLPNQAWPDFYKAHPDWFRPELQRQPLSECGALRHLRETARTTNEYLPGILREIIERSRPEGFTDNSWSGLGRNSICYCDNCERKFRARGGKPIPTKADWDDPVYRDWIMWNYARRLEIWDLNNRTTKAAGGPDCIWVGMNSGSIGGKAPRSATTRAFASVPT